MKNLGNITGAFADGAILFPLLAALVWQTGMDGAVLLATSGAAYIAAGAIFRVPMSMQPLKSVVVAALALGATATEIHISGLAVGVFCLGLSFCYADKLAAIVPRHLVQGLQLGLGIILMLKGLDWGLGGGADLVVFAILAGGFVLLHLKSSKPVMGWVATFGLLAALFMVLVKEPVSVPPEQVGLRLDIILALVLPQLALTLTNSVVATHDVAQRYFGEEAARVKPSWLLRSIGLGNVISAALGGLPFCHGSGGLTAHVKGGARNWHMNLIVGGFLLALAGLSWIFNMDIVPAYPEILMAVLLFATGFFHLQLAAPSWKKLHLRWILVVMAVTAFVTHNMLWILAVGVICETVRRVFIAQAPQAAE